LIHFIRPHKGQITTASRVKEFLEGSEIIEQEKIRAGSVFISLHSTSSWRFKDAIDYVKKVFKTEINSVTDNPNIFIESDQIISEVIFTDNHWHCIGLLAIALN
jgi:histidine ammonia-lyase